MSTSGATGVLTVPDTFTGLVTLAGGVVTTSVVRATVTKTATYSVGALDDLILCDTTAAPFTITIPTAVGATGRTITIKKIASSANALTVASAGGLIDGAATILPLLKESYALTSDGANWQIGSQAVATLI